MRSLSAYLGNHTPGALLLAHLLPLSLVRKTASYYKEHIADRIAIAVGNADA
ncbi:hypothetical protein ACLBOM_12265 [Escherichia coli]